MDKAAIELLLKSPLPVFKDSGPLILLFSRSMMVFFLNHFDLYPKTRKARVALSKEGGFVGIYEDPQHGLIKLYIHASWKSFE